MLPLCNPDDGPYFHPNAHDIETTTAQNLDCKRQRLCEVESKLGMQQCIARAAADVQIAEPPRRNCCAEGVGGR